MSDRDAEKEPLSTDAHDRAAEAFVERALSRFRDEIAELYVFGSTVRDETRGLASDVDVLAVLDSSDYQETADQLRDLAYDVMLEHGPVVELHILPRSEFEQSRTQENPVIRNVVNEGQSYA
jgi:predicted nucleotidyltransferase